MRARADDIAAVGDPRGALMIYEDLQRKNDRSKTRPFERSARCNAIVGILHSARRALSPRT